MIEPLYVIDKGLRVAFEDRALAYEETTQTTADEFGMRVRVVTQGMAGLLSVRHLRRLWADRWIAFQLVSHKILRWMVPIFLLLALASSAVLMARPMFRLILGAQLTFYAIALLSILLPLHRRWKVLGIPLYFCTLNAAALVSMFQVMRGRRYATWETVRH